MIGFQSLFRALKAGCLGKDMGGAKEEVGGPLCIVCCKFHSPRKPDARIDRARRSGDLPADVKEILKTSGSTFLEEFCHQLKITNEEFLESLSSKGTADASWTWTVCKTCFPFIERVVNRRRRCMLLEDRVNRLQLQLLKELKRLKEGMDQFYMDLMEVQGLVNGADTNNPAYRDEMDDKHVDGLHSFRTRILEVLNELQSYQTDVDARLLYPKMTIHEADDQLPVKQEVLSDTELGVDPDSDVDWTLNGLYEDDSCPKDVGSSASDDENGATSIKEKTPSIFKSKRKRSYFTKRANPEEDSDMDWTISKTEDKDDLDLADDDNDGSCSDYDYHPTSAKKPEKLKAINVKKKVLAKKGRPKGSKTKLKSKTEVKPAESSVLIARKKRIRKRKQPPPESYTKKSSSGLDTKSNVELTKDDTSENNTKLKIGHDDSSAEKSLQTLPSSSRKRKIKCNQESDMEWDLSGLDDNDVFEGDNGTSSDSDYSPSKSRTYQKLNSGAEEQGEEDVKLKVNSEFETQNPSDIPLPPSETPPIKRRRRRKKFVIINRAKPNVPPGLNKEEVLRADHDLKLAGLAYTRKYFIIRSERVQAEKSQLSAVKEGSEEELLRKRAKYSLEYDSAGGKLILEGVEVILNDKANLIKCSRCPFQVTWTEMKAKLKKNRSEHVVAARLEQKMADHILGVHLDAFNCPFCDLKTTLWHKYFSHVKYVHLSFHDCEVCGRPSMNRQTLKMHMWTHRSEEERKGLDPPERYRSDKSYYTEPVTCDECGKQLKSAQVLKQHKKTHMPEVDRVCCPVCGKVMRKYHYDRYHKKYTCPIVDDEAPTGWESFNQRGIQCVHCPVVLKNLLNLKCHIARAHSGQTESHLCPTCGKGFGAKMNLSLHMKRHENEKTSVCGWGCGEEFNEKRRRFQHEAVCLIKPETAPTEPLVRGEKEPHPCLHCTETLKNKQLFRQHMKRFHNPEADARVHECEVCNKRFRTRGDLTDHLQTHREDRPWKCSWGCGKSFNVKGNWKEHEARCKSKQMVEEKVEQQINKIITT